MEARSWGLRAVAPAIVGLYLLVHVLTLSWVPLVWMDEPWYTQPAWSFATRGTFAEPMFAGQYGHEVSNVAYGRIYLAIEALAFKLLGVGHWQARVPSLIAALAALVLLYVFAKRLFGQTAAVVAVVLTGTSVPFFLQSHDARPEMLLLAFMLGALLLVTEAEQRTSLALYALAGLVAALAADTHLNGIIVPVAVGAFLLARTGIKRDALWPAVTFAAGGIAGLAWWYLVHVAPDPELFRAQWEGVWGIAPLPIEEMAHEPLAPFRGEWRRLMAFVSATTSAVPLLAVSVVGFAVAAVTGRCRESRSIVVLTLVAALLMALVVSNKTPTYVILLLPMFALGFASLLREPSARSRWLLVGVTVLVALASTFSVGRVLIAVRGNDFGRYVTSIRSHIPEGATVQGEPTIWYGLSDHAFWGDHYFKGREGYGDEVRKLGIDYIVADDFFTNVMLDQEQSVDAAEVRKFLAEETELVSIVEDDFYGGDTSPGPHTTRIYRVLPASD